MENQDTAPVFVNDVGGEDVVTDTYNHNDNNTNATSNEEHCRGTELVNDTCIHDTYDVSGDSGECNVM